MGLDIVSGGEGDDALFLDDGNGKYALQNSISNSGGDDFVRGSAGWDAMIDLLGSNDLRGDLGRDTIITFDGLSDEGNYGS